jgi:hypothetical protein
MPTSGRPGWLSRDAMPNGQSEELSNWGEHLVCLVIPAGPS